MAVTKIWNIKGYIGRSVIYIENPDKTENPKYEESGYGEKSLQSMQDVMVYAMRDEKASDLGHALDYATDAKKTEQQYFVSGVNCKPENAREKMTATKIRFDKQGGNTAYHAIQAFKPGEVNPDMAHEIGLKLAQELWGKRFEVVVATHLDQSHVHNHFIINSVSFKDGYKFYDSQRFWRQMARTSDKICLEHGLKVQENAVPGKGKNYAEIKAEREGVPTFRGLVKSEIDEIIKMSMTESQFFKNLKARGYEHKIGKYFAVRPPGKENFIRLDRNFGESYSIAGINKRINAQQRPVYPPAPPPKRVVHMQFRGNFKKTKKLTGFRALYVHYLFLLGKIPKHNPKRNNPNMVYFLYREDLRKLDKYANEIKLLSRNRIDTSEQLFSYKVGLTAKLADLTSQRKVLYNKSRGLKDETAKEAVTLDIKTLSAQIRQARKEVGLCDDIAAHTQEMKVKMAKERQDKSKNLTGKEKSDHVQLR